MNQINELYLYVLVPKQAEIFKVGITSSPANRLQSFKENIDLEASRLFRGDATAVANMERALHAFLKPWNKRRDFNAAGGGYTEWFDMACYGKVETFLNHFLEAWECELKSEDIAPFATPRSVIARTLQPKADSYGTWDHPKIDVLPALKMKPGYALYPGLPTETLEAVYLTSFSHTNELIEPLARMFLAFHRLVKEGTMEPLKVKPIPFSKLAWAYDYCLEDNDESLSEFIELVHQAVSGRLLIKSEHGQDMTSCWFGIVSNKEPQHIATSPAYIFEFIEDIDITRFRQIVATAID
uniref:Bacteriophage T5 Orf172 DNA-binding domain-containing protein n=1 Tax=feces metagenome TaxID=1861841 RepID=A0A7M2QNR8_9ZZZZ